jgi:hypothetical protein
MADLLAESIGERMGFLSARLGHEQVQAVYCISTSRFGCGHKCLHQIWERNVVVVKE